MTARRLSGIFGGHAETIPAHRMENFKALRLFVTRHDIAHRVIAHMTHMDAARWIREHFQRIELWLVALIMGAEHILLVPDFLPAGLYIGGIIFFGHLRHIKGMKFKRGL